MGPCLFVSHSGAIVCYMDSETEAHTRGTIHLMFIYTCMHIYIYIYIHMHMCIYMCVSIHVYTICLGSSASTRILSCPRTRRVERLHLNWAGILTWTLQCSAFVSLLWFAVLTQQQELHLEIQVPSLFRHAAILARFFLRSSA